MKRNTIIFIILFLAALFILFGCKAKRVTHTIYKTDTIKEHSVLKIQTPQLNSIRIDEVCDSLGNLKPITHTFNSGKVKTVFKTVDNTIYLEQNIDSIIDSEINKYKSSITKEKEVLIKYKTPKWAWYSLIFSILATVWIFRKPLLRIIKPI